MKKTAFILLLFLFLAACNLGREFKELIQLSKDINEKYRINSNVKISNTKITVTISNTSYSDSSDEVKQRVSDDIGQMVQAYPEIAKGLEEGITVFEEKTNVAIVGISKQSSFPMHLGKK